MKYIKCSKNIAISLYVSLLVLTIVLAVNLIQQYRFFKQENQELLQVKESYYQHIDMLKRSLNASLSTQLADVEEEIDRSDSKKKNAQANPQLVIDTVKNTTVLTKQEHDFALINPEEEDKLHKIKHRLHEFKSAASLTNKTMLKKMHQVPSNKKKIKRYTPVRDFAFAWPVELSKFWLSSLYGPRRLSNGKMSFHYAIDMAALKGTLVKAAAAGKVQASIGNTGYGNCIVLYHNERYKTRYAHLDTILVNTGQTVKKGEVIGTVGDTGFVRKAGKDASHLHFEIYQDGERVNPLHFLFT